MLPFSIFFLRSGYYPTMIMNQREATSKHKVKLTGYATMWRFDAE
jgi:hypothetical protein